MEKLKPIRFDRTFTLGITNVLYGNNNIKEIVVEDIPSNFVINELSGTFDNEQLEERLNKILLEDETIELEDIFLKYIDIDEDTILFRECEDDCWFDFDVECTFDTERFARDYNLTPQKDKGKDNIELN